MDGKKMEGKGKNESDKMERGGGNGDDKMKGK